MSKTKLSEIKKPTKLKKIIFPLGVVTILIFGFAFWSFFRDEIQGKKLYAQAAGHKIYKEEVSELIGDSDGASEREAAEVLADKYLTEAMAEERNISVSEEDLVRRYGEQIKNQKEGDKFAYQNKVNQLYFDKLSAYNAGVYRGDLLVTHFSRYIPYESALLPEDKAGNPKIGNKAAMAKDKKYAEDLITDLYNRIKSEEITFKEAAKIEKSDSVVGETEYPSLPHSGSFDTSLASDGLINSEFVKQQINEIAPGQISEPFAVKVSNSVDYDSFIDSYFLVIKLDESSGGRDGIDFQQELEQAKDELRYEVYV